MIPTMRLEGGQALKATLAALPQAVSKKIMRTVLVEAAEPMVAVARQKAPREPGAPDPKENIEIGNPRTRTDEGGEMSTTVVWGPLKAFFYGFFQEFGTVHHGAQPFMRPAFDSQKERSLSIIVRRTWEHIQSWVLSRDVR